MGSLRMEALMFDVGHTLSIGDRGSGRVVVLIPTYNSSPTIRETLASLIEQGKHLANVAGVLIADDFSSDDTARVVTTTWRSAVPLRILPAGRNLGERGNVNRAIGSIRAAADWVLILHADDVAKSNWLEVMLERTRVCDARVASICSSWDNWLPDGSVIQGEDNRARAVEVISGDIASVKGTLKRGCWWHISGCAIRLAAFDDVGGFDPSLPQVGDWEWLLRCLSHGWRIEYVPRTLIKYRQHGASVSTASSYLDRDIRESLGMFRRYAGILTPTELLGLHSRRVTYCIRRSLRALASRDVRRLLFVAHTLWLVSVNLVASLQHKRELRKLRL
jgi:GT2 family glycosyltransferase